MGSTEEACYPRTVSPRTQSYDYWGRNIPGRRVLDALVMASGWVVGRFLNCKRILLPVQRREKARTPVWRRLSQVQGKCSPLGSNDPTLA